MRILVDFDNVMVNTGECWIEWLNKQHNTTVKWNGVCDYDLTKAFHTLSSDEIFSPLQKEEFWRMVSPMPSAVRTLKRLVDEGNEVIVCTATWPDTYGMKYKLVLNKFFPFIGVDNIIVAHRKQMILGDLLIDDAPFNLIGGKYASVLFDAPHNRNFDNASSGIDRLLSWNCFDIRKYM